ncbi:MAG: energy-coupling factor ABC transporter permease [Pirellulaceae bacterium]|nr:energy-coupling factor ABC transporter permease [Pirellulaceae bacterium]
MHLGNGAITPECAALTWGAAAAGLGLAGWLARRDGIDRERLALAGGLGALVFAAQAINVPLLPGTSAHLVGGVLLAWAVGPGLGAWTMALILTLQAVLLGDGGLLSLGANILNMAILPAGLVAAVRPERDSAPAWKPALLAAISVPLAALLIVGQTALFRGGELAGWSDFAARMVVTHLWIGVAEGGLTLLLVLALAMLTQPAARWRQAMAALAGALVLACLVPLSSSLPDGYEAAAQRAGLQRLLAE